MKSILITGINSFTGNYLSGILKRKGYNVYGSVYKKQDESIKNNYFYANLFDLDSIKELVENVKPDKVIHLAAISFVSHENINELYNTNLLGTRNLLSSLEQSNKTPEQIILSSSANIYGNVENEMIDEKYPFRPINDYAVSKASMELIANIWKEKLPITILRPFNYTGIGQSKKFLIPKIIYHFQMKKKFIELGNIEVFRDFSDVRDVAEIYSEILDLNLVGETYNICTGKTISLREIIETVSNYAGYKIEIIKNPQFIRSNEVKYLRGSSEKLFKKIKKNSMRDIKETIYWMYRGKI